MEFTGTYYQCIDCNHIWDYEDSHCPECGSEKETDLSPNEIKNISRQMIIKGYALISMLENHDDN